MMNEENQPVMQEDPEDKLEMGLKILSFCIPLAGAVIYFTNKDTKPNKAKEACYAALIGLVLVLC